MKINFFKSKEQRDAETIHKLIIGTFETELGRRLLDHLVDVFVDRPIYKDGDTIDKTAYRQGQSDLIKQLIKEMK